MHKVKGLCLLIYTEKLNKENLDPQDSLEDFMQLNIDEMIDYVQLVAASLLQDRGIDEPSYKGYQKALQKLEAEVRKHITVSGSQIQEELKLYIDHLEETAELTHNSIPKETQPVASVTLLETDKSDLRSKLHQEAQNLILTEELEKVKKELLKAKDQVQELEKKCGLLEAKLIQALNRAELRSNHDIKFEALRKKYEEKCADMVLLVKKLNSSALKVKNYHSLKETLVHDTRRNTPLKGSILKQQLSKVLHTQVIHFPAAPIRHKSVERSKSTERLHGQFSRNSSKLRGELSGTLRKLA